MAGMLLPIVVVAIALSFFNVAITTSFHNHLSDVSVVAPWTEDLHRRARQDRSHDDSTSVVVVVPRPHQNDTFYFTNFTSVRPLRKLDFTHYTIRINTWKRPNQLNVSLNHYLQCDGVAQIQVVWCDDQGDPPAWLEGYSNPKVVLERHSVNSLNERFHILTNHTPTLGVLSIDDDTLRPCDSLDSGFFKWVASPHRMVGFEARTYFVGNDNRWKYGYQFKVEETNKYSASLTKFCFLHRDYLDWYYEHLPSRIYDHIDEKFNCEDIAMSFMVSSLTEGKPPLLVDGWASRKTVVKIYSPTGISSNRLHKSTRDNCTDDFATILGLKQSSSSSSQQQQQKQQQQQQQQDIVERPLLRTAPYKRDIRNRFFHFGDGTDQNGNDKDYYKIPGHAKRQKVESGTGLSIIINKGTNGHHQIYNKRKRQRLLESHVRELHKYSRRKDFDMNRVMEVMKSRVKEQVKALGFLEHTQEWHKKFNISSNFTNYTIEWNRRQRR